MRRTTAQRNDYIVRNPVWDWNEGIRGTHATRLEFWGNSAYADCD